jgi:endonuclease YncB( thermonuclease family)
MRQRRLRKSILSGRLGWLLAVVLLGLAALIAARLEPAAPDLNGRAYAADGDTLHVGRQRVRLLGIDAPELDQTCWDKDEKSWPCGQAAKKRLAALLAGAAIVCHPSGHDKYGRARATCDADGRDLGAILMREGLAISYDGYKVEEGAARLASGRAASKRLGSGEMPRASPARWIGSGSFSAESCMAESTLTNARILLCSRCRGGHFANLSVFEPICAN